jgi:primosomal protein N' (replication factor Y) (superfamily II helicase)
MTPSPSIVQVSLPVALYRPLTYSVPPALAQRVAIGSRVVVPVRGRRELGFVVSQAAAPEGVALKPIHDAPDEQPVLDESMLSLCQWIADYYIAPLGMVLRTALPASLTGADAPEPSRKTRRVAAIATELPTLIERDQAFARARKQRDVYELLESLGGSAPVDLLLERMSFSPTVLRGLEDRKLVAIRSEVVARDPFAARPRAAPADHQPTAAQRAAIDTLASANAGDAFLLHGVTGSGKTLV